MQPSIYMQTGTTGTIPLGTIQLNGTALDASGSSGGAISLGASSRTAYSSVATIFGSSTSNNSLTFTGGSFTMGPNEAMTIYGNATFNLTGAATFGYRGSECSSSVTASSITLTSRPAITLLLRQMDPFIVARPLTFTAERHRLLVRR